MSESSQACDLAVVGGGMAGCLCALHAARAGRRVALIEHGTYLGRPFTSGLRTWIGRHGWPRLDERLKDLLTLPPCGDADIDLSSLPVWTHAEIPLFRGSLKKKLLAELLDQGVTVLLMCRAAGTLRDQHGLRGILLANKQGLQILPTSVVIDTTPGADLCGTAVDGPILRRYAVGFSGARIPPTATVAAPPSLGIAGHEIRFHAGASSRCPVYAEFAFTARTRNGAEIEARRLAVEASRFLIGNVEGFERSHVFEIAGETIRDRPSLAGTDHTLPAGILRFTGHLPAQATCRDLRQVREEAAEIAGRCAQASPPGEPTGGDAHLHSGESTIPLTAFTTAALPDPKLGLNLTALEMDRPDLLPLRQDCDVLVAGAGTAGANAALAALGAGAKTVVMEANTDLGGTQTVGMVASYYHGYRGGYTEWQEERLEAFSDYLQPNGHALRRTTKMLFYSRQIAEAGGQCLLDCKVCGGVVRQEKVRGLIGADADGVFRVEAKVTVDATGDGDAARFCGARTFFGDPRNGNAQDCSQWSKGKGKRGAVSPHLDLDVIDQRFLSETLRGLRIAHRKGADFDFAAMLTVREGRHVAGDYTLSLKDILEGRTFEDGIAEAQTDWDPHGISSSWLGRLGYLPVHCAQLYARIPYRCCLPKGLSGMIVSAKAISATPDAACLCRMAADIQNLGWATGLAAAWAARSNGDTRATDLAELRRQLTDMGILRRDQPPRARVTGTAAERVQRLADGDEGALLAVALLPEEDALPLLQRAFDSPASDRHQVARGLAWFGDASGAELVRDALDTITLREGDRYDDTHPHKEGNPKAGIVDEPDDYWRVNQLLVLLGLIRDTTATARIADVIERTRAGGEPIRAANPYVAGRIDMQRVPHFDRLLCIAFCVERLAAPELIAPMECLLNREHIGGYLTIHDEEAAGPAYHGALAEVALAAAAARCGSRGGMKRLIDFLQDLHHILGAFARRELNAVSGVDLGRDPAAWRDWLATTWSPTSVPLEKTPRVF